MAKEPTVEELNVQIEALKAENTELKSEIKTLKVANKKLSVTTAKVTHEVPGTYKSEDGREFKFSKGHVKTRWNNEIVDSSTLLSNKEAMEYLIDIKYGGIEEVK